MLFSANTYNTLRKLGDREGVRAMLDAGFPALDMSFFAGSWLFTHEGNKLALAKELRAIADGSGAVFNQAHAPFGRTEVFYEKFLPVFPEMFECCAILGVKNIVVHPLHDLPYYGNEEALFDMNMEFYSSLKHFAEDSGVRIALENMWQYHPKKRQVVDSVGSDPHELCRYYDTLNDPKHFTVCLDLGHVALCDREPEDAILTVGHDRLGALHVHDVDYVSDLHTVPFGSKMNWDNICRSLAQIDYKGDLTLEADNFFKDVDNEFYPTVLKFMADVARHLTKKIEGYKQASI